jgi:ABC-2 type transport system permease protein
MEALKDAGLRQYVTVKELSSTAAVVDAIRAKTVQAGLVIPAGFSVASTGLHPLDLQVLTSVNNSIAGTITSSLAASFAAQLNADRLSVTTASAAGVPADQTARLAAAAARLRIPEQAVQRPIGARPLKAVSYYSPAMAIFFLLFTVSFTARSFFVDRANGMIERMLSAPIHPYGILAGKALSVFVFGVASLTIIAVVTTTAFGANWGNPTAAAVLCLAMVISVVCVTAFVIVVARTQRQAEGFAAIAVFGLALLGGNFLFLSTAPTVIRHLALLTPNGWALRGFTDLATKGGGLGTVVLPVGAIVMFSLVVGGLAVLLARRALTS